MKITKMKITKILADKRNIWNLGPILSKKPSDYIPKQISFIYTVDVERHNGQFDSKKLEKSLDIIEDFGKGTFFLDPKLLETHSLNFGKNEVGNHGYDHSAMGSDWWMKPNDYKISKQESVEKSTQLIRDHLKIKPISFRCPKFSIDKDVFSLLKKNGYTIDSSISPHNPTLFPHIREGMKEIPVSRMIKPRLKFSPIPFYRYDSLMMKVLQEKGVEGFTKLSKNILAYWKGKKNPELSFMSHQWEFQKDEFHKLRHYFEELEKLTKVKFVTMKDYAKKF